MLTFCLTSNKRVDRNPLPTRKPLIARGAGEGDGNASGAFVAATGGALAVLQC